VRGFSSVPRPGSVVGLPCVNDPPGTRRNSNVWPPAVMTCRSGAADGVAEAGCAHPGVPETATAAKRAKGASRARRGQGAGNRMGRILARTWLVGIFPGARARSRSYIRTPSTAPGHCCTTISSPRWMSGAVKPRSGVPCSVRETMAFQVGPAKRASRGRSCQP
jgi:hypothetical protein